MFSDRMREAAKAAHRGDLDEISQKLWAAHRDGLIGDDEANAIDEIIHARRREPARSPTPPRRVGSRPRSAASLDRRRRWVASGLLPPVIAASFTMGEAAALAVVAAEVAKRGEVVSQGMTRGLHPERRAACRAAARE